MAIILPLQKETERKRSNNKLAIVLPEGKERKKTKNKIGDSPALREREDKDQATSW